MNSPPLCRFCGGKIAKRTTAYSLRATGAEADINDTTYWKHLRVDAFPTTKAGCQKLTNLTVVSVSKRNWGDEPGLIDSFTAWDGESYVDEFFCNGDHAKRFGYVAARTGSYMSAYEEALNKIGVLVAPEAGK